MKRDLGDMIVRMMHNEVPVPFSEPEQASGNNVTWLFSPRTYMFLYNLESTGGREVFKGEMVTNRTVMSVPFKVTTAIPDNLGNNGNQTEIYLTEPRFSNIIEESGGVDIGVYKEAAYIENNEMISAVQKNQTHPTPVSYTHLRAHRDRTRSRMPSSA